MSIHDYFVWKWRLAMVELRLTGYALGAFLLVVACVYAWLWTRERLGRS